MNEFEAVGIMILLFALRCALPVALMFGVGYLMNWLVDHWQREDEARRKRQRTYCVSYTQYGNYCWSKRLTAEGALPAVCVNCPIYLQAMRAA